MCPSVENYWGDKAGRGQPRRSTFLWKITGAATQKNLNANASLAQSGAITDAAVATFLGETSSPFLADSFDATSMGADVFGGVIDMGGQVQELYGMRAEVLTADTGATVVKGGEAAANLTATLLTECAAKNGNIGFKVNFGNSPDFDGLTAGLIIVEFFWRSK